MIELEAKDVTEFGARVRESARATARALTLLAGSTPHDVIARRGPARLRYYAPQGETTHTPVLLVMPIINRFRVVDLQPEGSLVKSLIERGIPVYLVDWGQPARIDAGTDWEDYVLKTLPRFRRAIPHQGPLDVIGYCLGGTISILYASRFPQQVRKLVTLNTPVDFHTGAPHMDLLGLWVQPEAFPVDALTEAFGNMPHQLISQGFVWQRPLSSAEKFVKAFQKAEDGSFADFFTVLESWNQDGVDVPGQAYRRLIKDLYRENKLVKGEFMLGGRPVDLGQITCPVLVVTSQHDTTAPPCSATALIGRVSGPAEELALKGGHITAIVGPKAPQFLHGPLCDWLAK